MYTRALLVAGVALAGCFEKPPFAGELDGVRCPEGDELTTHLDGERLVVCGGADGYSMRFSDRGHGFPDRLEIGGVELAGHGDSCDDQEGFGLDLAPAGMIDGRDPAGAQRVVGGRRVAVELASPFLVKVGVDWEASFAAACPFAPRGRSTFTFVRGGRIARHDHVVDTSTALATACPGACPGRDGDTWAMTTFATFAATPGQTITHVPVPAEDDDGPGTSFDERTACLRANEYTVALGWTEWLPRRLRVPAPGQRAFIADVLPESPAKLPALVDQWLHNVFLVAPPGEACAAAEARVAPWNEDPQLEINDSPYGSGHDGIWGGENDDGLRGLELATGRATIRRWVDSTVDIPAGWVVWLRFGATHPGYDVVKTGGDTTGEWFAWSVVPNSDGALFWFRDPLRSGEIVTIDPRD